MSATEQEKLSGEQAKRAASTSTGGSPPPSKQRTADIMVSDTEDEEVSMMELMKFMKREARERRKQALEQEKRFNSLTVKLQESN